jgi:hypothetical protein
MFILFSNDSVVFSKNFENFSKLLKYDQIKKLPTSKFSFNDIFMQI